MKLLFVGERPSPKAVKMNVKWKDGRLAAKQLFDALKANNIDPANCLFDNIFVERHYGEEVICQKAINRICKKSKSGFQIVAMGQKVASALQDKVKFIPIVHPAARGKIRKKENYIEHIRMTLTLDT